MSHRNQSTARTALAILLAAVVMAGIGYFVYAFFKVRHVQASGNAFYTSQYVAALAGIEPGTHMFAVDDARIESNVELAEPYLQVVRVTRTYPDTVTVHVEERRPEAVFPYNDQFLLADIDSVVLETIPDRSVTDRPMVLGVSIAGVEMGQPITTSDNFKLSVLKEILEELDARELFELIDVIDLSNINNIQLTSTNGLRISFGQAEKISDKIKWIQNRLPALERDGQTSGVLDVSAGSFATYTMMDGASGSASSPLTPSSGPEEGEAGPSASPSSDGYHDGASGTGSSRSPED